MNQLVRPAERLLNSIEYYVQGIIHTCMYRTLYIHVAVISIIDPTQYTVQYSTM